MELIVKDRLNNDQLFIDNTDTPKEVIEEHTKKKMLKGCIKNRERVLTRY